MAGSSVVVGLAQVRYEDILRGPRGQLADLRRRLQGAAPQPAETNHRRQCRLAGAEVGLSHSQGERPPHQSHRLQRRDVRHQQQRIAGAGCAHRQPDLAVQGHTVRQGGRQPRRGDSGRPGLLRHRGRSPGGARPADRAPCSGRRNTATSKTGSSPRRRRWH